MAKEIVPKFYMVYIQFGNPSFVVSRAAQFWRLIHDTGDLYVMPVGADALTARLMNKVYPHKAFCAGLIGFCQGVLELSGAKEVSIEEVKCAARGADCCEFEASWK